MLDKPVKIPVVVHLTPEEHAALMDFVSKITNDVNAPSVARYLIADYLASELGYEIDVPEITF